MHVSKDTMINENDRFWTTKVCFQYLDIHFPCHHGTRIVFSALREVVSTYLMKTSGFGLSMNTQTYILNKTRALFTPTALCKNKKWFGNTPILAYNTFS